MDSVLKKNLLEVAAGQGRITVMTGAGISAESGIPTFRGPEGYWTVGSKEYHPQEMATYSMFRQYPEQVWAWYLYRLGVCRRAYANEGHRALVRLEKLFVERFTLITQNVDGLHLRAGSSPERTFQIHGNIFFMRCADGCRTDLVPMPDFVEGKEKGEPLTEGDRSALRCPACGGWSRPHVLWFDETYNEEHFRFVSSLKIASATDLLLIVGTSGATNLPNQVAWRVHERGGTIVDINIEQDPFSRLAVSGGGHFIQGPAAKVLPEIVDVLKAGMRNRIKVHRPGESSCQARNSNLEIRNKSEIQMTKRPK
ncbi:MAG: RNA polymerase subunit sigma [Desulfobacterales bacterium]|nr:RNA polymerase subunit sigma [Desulfobacterales bacterium]